MFLRQAPENGSKVMGFSYETLNERSLGRRIHTRYRSSTVQATEHMFISKVSMGITKFTPAQTYCMNMETSIFAGEWLQNLTPVSELGLCNLSKDIRVLSHATNSATLDFSFMDSYPKNCQILVTSYDEQGGTEDPL